jgi:hypothetical protein
MTELGAGPPSLEPPDGSIDTHAHHWLIGRQDGPSSEGVCKSCGATREFTNAYSRTYRSPIFMGRAPRNSRPYSG